MSVDHSAYQLALRTRLLSLSVCSFTGSVSVSPTGGLNGHSAYIRTSGSYITDGFTSGMEISGSSFTSATNNGLSIVLAVEALRLTVSRLLAAEAVATRTISVGLPGDRSWENANFIPRRGVPYVREEYIPGPETKISIGPDGIVEVRPTYIVKVAVPASIGALTGRRYSKAIRDLFPTGYTIIMASSDVLRVRTDQAPFEGQQINEKPGWVIIPVTFPLWLQTINSI